MAYSIRHVLPWFQTCYRVPTVLSATATPASMSEQVQIRVPLHRNYPSKSPLPRTFQHPFPKVLVATALGYSPCAFLMGLTQDRGFKRSREEAGAWSPEE